MSRPADHGPHPRHGLHAALQEALAAEAGIDGHHQHEVDEVEQRLDHRGGRAGVDRDAGALAEVADGLERAVDVRPGLGMDGDRRRRRPRRRPRGRGRPGRSSGERRRTCRVCGRSAFTTGGPKVMLGTKWPSITSRWIQSAPAASTARVSSAEPREIGREDRGGDDGRQHHGSSNCDRAEIGVRRTGRPPGPHPEVPGGERRFGSSTVRLPGQARRRRRSTSCMIIGVRISCMARSSLPPGITMELARLMKLSWIMETR